MKINTEYLNWSKNRTWHYLRQFDINGAAYRVLSLALTWAQYVAAATVVAEAVLVVDAVVEVVEAVEAVDAVVEVVDAVVGVVNIVLA